MVTLGERAGGRAPARRRVRLPSVQLKFVMAASGVIMLLFLIGHMVGNLKIFLGAEAIDTYAHWLRTVGEPAVPEQTLLWIMRVVLTAALLGHIGSAIVLTRRAHKARPVKYVHHRKVQGSYAARTMRWGGVIIALFLVWHILDLTTGTVNPNGVSGAVYDNVAADFAPDRWYVTLFYSLAVVAVGIHVRHGMWSALQSIGRSSVATQRTLKGVALGLAIVLTAGFLSVPFAVLTGLVG
ncbi:succinate dehydrogenase cytochrome b subunit [Pseudonocardia sp. GCM10023141]|uniref:succinate dehydrogenase cytochrome b subunit n=1 Tax=Pseudonocardia sp. GCM10023141 TaxID=3252653 RepID=UPI00361D0D85